MVSRGGRSKGCTNCRRRRVKCDEKRPVCSQCMKRGLDCDGPKELTWIHQETPPGRAPVSAVVKIDYPAQLSLAAFEQDICLAYSRKNLLRGGPVEIACNMVDFQEGASSVNPGLETLRGAILSLSMAFFGSQHSQDRITTKGYQQYGEVMRQLNTQLARPEQQITNETLLTVLICMLLEIFMPTGPTNFLKHGRGIEAIMKLRGPPTESAGTTATIFRGLRILSVVSALAEARSSIYADPEWRKVSPGLTAHYTEAGMLQHQIFTVLADCTRIISQRDTLLASKAAPESYETLMREVYVVLGDLEALHPHWEALNRRQLAEAEELSDLAKESGIANHVSATAYMLYNTAYMCVLQIKHSLSPSPVDIALRDTAAITIAKCMELKTSEQQQGAPQSNTVAFVAMKVAWQALGGFDSSEGQKLARVVKSTCSGVFPRSHRHYHQHTYYPSCNLWAPYPSTDQLALPVGSRCTGYGNNNSTLMTSGTNSRRHQYHISPLS